MVWNTSLKSLDVYSTTELRTMEQSSFTLHLNVIEERTGSNRILLTKQSWSNPNDGKGPAIRADHVLALKNLADRFATFEDRLNSLFNGNEEPREISLRTKRNLDLISGHVYLRAKRRDVNLRAKRDVELNANRNLNLAGDEVSRFFERLPRSFRERRGNYRGCRSAAVYAVFRKIEETGKRRNERDHIFETSTVGSWVGRWLFTRLRYRCGC